MTLWLAALAQVVVLMPYSGDAHAQRWERDRPGWHQDRWERLRADHHGRERERERRDDAKAAGVVAGVVGTAVLVGVIAAAAKRENDQRQRIDYCMSRYGNYDPGTDIYRARNGYAYRCE
jgi:hypothetical protein